MKINTKTTGERISSLRKEKGLKQIDLAKELNVSRQIISYYETGTRMPNVEDIVILSEILNTSTDYLLGLSDVKTNDKDVKFICDYTGLNELSVRILNEFKRVSNFDFINKLICTSDFLTGADDYKQYLELVNDRLEEPINMMITYEYSADEFESLKNRLLSQLDISDKIDLRYFRIIESFKDCLNDFTSGKQKALDKKRSEIQEAILKLEVKEYADNNEA